MKFLTHFNKEHFNFYKRVAAGVNKIIGKKAINVKLSISGLRGVIEYDCSEIELLIYYKIAAKYY
jgi:hypothetical protein